eukprot:scaffold18271_cov71-Phaeocystis_antarctica.AAC.4
MIHHQSDERCVRQQLEEQPILARDVVEPGLAMLENDVEAAQQCGLCPARQRDQRPTEHEPPRCVTADRVAQSAATQSCERRGAMQQPARGNSRCAERQQDHLPTPLHVRRCWGADELEHGVHHGTASG